MEPTLRAGDLLLVWWGAGVRPGHLVVFEHPAHPGLLTVKRVTGPDPADSGRWWVERDHAMAGTDSWVFGSLGADDILARVVTRLPSSRHKE